MIAPIIITCIAYYGLALYLMHKLLTHFAGKGTVAKPYSEVWRRKAREAEQRMRYREIVEFKAKEDKKYLCK
jgi:hypothetical protein